MSKLNCTRQSGREETRPTLLRYFSTSFLLLNLTPSTATYVTPPRLPARALLSNSRPSTVTARGAIASTLDQAAYKSIPFEVTVELLGPFEEEEKGTGIASDVVKVKGEIRPPQVYCRKELTPGP